MAKRKHIELLAQAFDTKDKAKEQVKRFRAKIKSGVPAKTTDTQDSDSDWDTEDSASSMPPAHRSLIRDYVENEDAISDLNMQISKYENKMK